MSLRALLMTMVVAAAGVPALAMDYLVGDNMGWNPGVNYSLWVDGKHFRVGDSIVFTYTPGNHNVVEVNATEFQTCEYSNTTAKIFTSGNNVIALTAPGKKWYFSGIDDDCSAGVKLAITILAAEETAPAPAPLLGSPAPPPGTSSAAQVSAFKLSVSIIAYRMIMAS